MSEKPPQNEAQRKLRVLGVGSAELARICGVSRPAGHKWLTKGKPDPTNRAKIAAEWPEVTPVDWDLAPRTGRRAPDPPPAVRPPAADDAPVVPGWPVSPELAAAMAPPPLPPRPPDPEPPAAYVRADVELDAPGAARALVRAQLERLRLDTERLRAGRASDDAIRKAEDAERKAALDLAKLAGELNPTEEARLVKSVKWYAIREAVLKALEPWPEALAAVIAALAAEDA